MDKEVRVTRATASDLFGCQAEARMTIKRVGVLQDKVSLSKPDCSTTCSADQADSEIRLPLPYECWD